MNTDATNAVAEGLDPVKTTRPAVSHHPLTPTLALSVPLEIARLAALEPYQRAILIDAVLTDHRYPNSTWTRDDILFLGKHSGKGFAELTRILACLAWQPGGATALGLHVCARPHPHCPARGAQRAACCVCAAACTAAQPAGTCPQPECGWCANGCECCSSPAPFGRIVLLKQEAS